MKRSLEWSHPPLPRRKSLTAPLAIFRRHQAFLAVAIFVDGARGTAEPGDPQALADAILRLAQTPRVEREARSERATQLAHSTYSRQRINAEYNRLLREVIAR